MGSTQNVLDQIRALGPVTAEQRVALRMAAHAVPMHAEQSPRFIGPAEPPHPWISAPDLAKVLRVAPALRFQNSLSNDAVFLGKAQSPRVC